VQGLSGKIVIVTGAGQGIGAAYARRLASEGCMTVIAEINRDGADRVVAEIEGAGGIAMAVTTDVSDDSSVCSLVEGVESRFGRIDGLVNNAAIYFGLQPSPVSDISVEEWDRVMAVNVKGTFLCARAVYPVMKRQGLGQIVNVASTVALLGAPYFAHYAASKGAILALTRALAKEFGDDGVRVNAIVPGGTWSEASERLVPDEKVKQAIVSQQAIKREQFPEDLAGTVCFLLSDESAMTTGQGIVVDGGRYFA